VHRQGEGDGGTAFSVKFQEVRQPLSVAKEVGVKPLAVYFQVGHFFLVGFVGCGVPAARRFVGVAGGRFLQQPLGFEVNQVVGVEGKGVAADFTAVGLCGDDQVLTCGSVNLLDSGGQVHGGLL
jgi:hypothetical protein